MSTPHNNAEKGQINYLENPVCFNQVRGMLGYTGTWQGQPVSVMGHGMGMPSIGIYSYELFAFYDVEKIDLPFSQGYLLNSKHIVQIFPLTFRLYHQHPENGTPCPPTAGKFLPKIVFLPVLS